MSLTYEPLAVFHSSHQETYEAPRQGVLAEEATGWFELDKSVGPEAIEDLKGFDRIWLIYDFHKNSSWKSKVRPPRFSEKKRSVFSTRSPYRPNSIGMSCVKLEKIEKRMVFVSGHDILEGSPILDIKPYIPYADSFPEARTGWLREGERFEVCFDQSVEKQLEWLENQTRFGFKNIIENQLSYEPTNSKAKRVKLIGDDFVFAVRTWRFSFRLLDKKILVFSISSGYTNEDLKDEHDTYGDKRLHKDFIQIFNL